MTMSRANVEAARTVDLRLLKGPLDESWLNAIARLYGKYNAKYRDPMFCRQLFNENPHGYSLHAFVVCEREEVVGHYAIIPLDVTVEGERKLSGKGEAFVVEPDYRRAVVNAPGHGPIARSSAVALQIHLFRFALENGMELIHMIPTPEIGPLHRMTGCRPLAAEHLWAKLVIGRRPSTSAAHGRAAMQHALAKLQGWASTLAQGALLARWGKAWKWLGPELSSERLASIAADVPAPKGWSVAIDLPLLRWMKETSELEVVALNEAMENYAVVSRRAGDGGGMEVLLWRQRSGGLRAALRLLSAVVREARRAGKVIVTFSDCAAWQDEERAYLRAAGRLLLFHERRRDAGTYVFTRDRYYIDPGKLHFTPFFYAVS